ncbi:MAG TPA: CsbD family protein [Fontimonas sp.]
MKSVRDDDRVNEAIDDAAHSGAADKTKGRVKEVIGSVKANIGKAIGDRELEGKGHLQNAEGKKDRVKGEIKEAAEDVKDKVKAGVEVVKDKVREVRNR